MSALDRGIGSEGLEQGGPNLGNDYSRRDLTGGSAGDALTTPNTAGLANKEIDPDKVNMDNESSRDLSSTGSYADDKLDDLDIDENDLDDDDDDLVDVDEDDEEEE